LDATACDDGNACTIREDCQMGQCVTSLIVSCNDRNPCTPDFCDPGTGECLTEPPACDDGNPCTVDSCTIDGCDHQTLPEGSQCNDGNPCTLVETYQTGQCSAVSTRNCSDMDPCTRDQCDQDTGGCVQEATSCDDDVPLTDDSCDPGTGDCLHAPVVPQAVMSLDFISPTTMRWLPSPGASRWNTYRGTIPSGLMGNAARPDPYDHICFDSADLVGDGPTTATDFHTPSPGSAFYYVASGENALLEGPAVEDSAGGSFYPPNPCLTP